MHPKSSSKSIILNKVVIEQCIRKDLEDIFQNTQVSLYTQTYTKRTTALESVTVDLVVLELLQFPLFREENVLQFSQGYSGMKLKARMGKKGVLFPGLGVGVKSTVN